MKKIDAFLMIATAQIKAWRLEAAELDQENTAESTITATQLKIQALGFDDALRVFQRDGHLNNLKIPNYGEFTELYTNSVNNFRRLLDN